jgi:hypothetical protein
VRKVPRASKKSREIIAKIVKKYDKALKSLAKK